MPNDLLQILEQNFEYIFLFAIVWAICGFALTWLWLKKNGVSFPDLSTVQVLFQENRVSGRSHKSLITKLGGGRKSHKVILTNSELWVTAHFPFNLVAAYYDGIHKIPLSSISGVNETNNHVYIEFIRSNGASGKFELILSKQQEFMQLIKNAVNK